MYIKREDALNQLADWINSNEICLTNGLWKLNDRLKDIPAVEPKRGEWISLHNGKWECSECGIEVLIYAKGNFCPNCGCRMKGADDE